MSKAAAFFVGCLIAVGVTLSTRAENEAAIIPTGDAKVYGECPLAYKEIVTRWLETKLIDAPSAIVDWAELPKPGEYKTQKGDRFVGYVVDFKVNSRNQFGAYTGKQRYRVVIRNGDVVWGGRPRY